MAHAPRIGSARQGAPLLVGRVLAASAASAAVVALGAGCATEQDSAGPEPGVTVGEIEEEQYLLEGEYLGQEVTVSAAVNEVITDMRLEVDGGSYGDDSLLVIVEEPVDVQIGDVLRITGTVGQAHEVLEGETPIYDQSELYEKYETEPFLYAASVEPLSP